MNVIKHLREDSNVSGDLIKIDKIETINNKERKETKKACERFFLSVFSS